MNEISFLFFSLNILLALDTFIEYGEGVNEGREKGETRRQLELAIHCVRLCFVYDPPA